MKRFANTILLPLLFVCLVGRGYGQSPRHSAQLIPQGAPIVIKDCYYEWSGLFASNQQLFVQDMSTQLFRVYDSTGHFLYAFKPQFAFKDRKYAVGSPHVVNVLNMAQHLYLASFFSVLVYHKPDSQMKTIPISIDFKNDTIPYMRVAKGERIHLTTNHSWLTSSHVYSSLRYTKQTPSNVGFWLFMFKKMVRNKQVIKPSAVYHPSLPLLAVYRMADTTSKEVGDAKERIRVTPHAQFSHYVGQLDSHYYHLSRAGIRTVPGTDNISNCIDAAIDTVNGKVYAGYLHTPTISVFRLHQSGEGRIAAFGVAGQHMTPSDTLQQIKTHGRVRPSFRIARLLAQMSEMDREENVRRALSAYYFGLYVAPHHQLAFRLYSKPLAEWTYPALDSMYQKDKEKFRDYVRQKPLFLQIYDLSSNDRLIFDGPVPAPFKVLDVDKEGYLWAIAGQEYNDDQVLKYVIQKYRVMGNSGNYR